MSFSPSKRLVIFFWISMYYNTPSFTFMDPKITMKCTLQDGFEVHLKDPKVKTPSKLKQDCFKTTSRLHQEYLKTTSKLQTVIQRVLQNY